MLGLGLGALPVASVLYQLHAPAWMWALLALNGYAWPHLAYALASRAARPADAEQANLLVDAAMGGLWVALMQFNLMPSALLVAMLAMDRICAGGWRLFGKSLLLQCACCLLAAALGGFAFRPVSDMLNIAACLPMLLIYPIWLSTVNFALGQRVRQQNRLLDQLSRTDALTGLPNRTHWLEAAETALLRFRQHRRPASLILLDVDGFKQINDRHGHAVGDALLGELAAILRGSLRAQDTPGRLGGDEFGVVLPETDIERARAVAEQVCRHAERIGAADAERSLPWTLSLGVVEIDDGVADLREWVRRADMALYRAKSQGRNRVSHHADASEAAGRPAAASPG
ncbi:hypothetical protein ASG87_13625 [Frateuria sp. Soil773]|nr:hypothetical protein ASG87_13625 [Frateuria sp. Soil773]